MRALVVRLLVGVGLAGGVCGCCWAGMAGAAGVGLPDGRAYELVSPLGNGEVYEPRTVGNDSLVAEEPFRAAADGDAMTYVGGAPSSGVGGNGNLESRTLYNNEYLAGRTSDGWVASDIEPPPAAESESRPIYQSFSDDLSTGFLSSSDSPRLAGAPACTGSDLYSRSSTGGAFAALFTSTLTGKCGRPLFAGMSADRSHVLFQSEAALVSPAVSTAGGPSFSAFCEYDCNLYESVGGVVSLVNLLPGNGGVDATATFGGVSGNGEYDQPDLSNVISTDGSRVVWSDVNTEVIYVREDGVRTVQASAGAARFWTASVDGRFVFYTEGERLLRFDTDSGTREELVDVGAGVQGVVGTSEDGWYVYFVANGVLAAGATPGSCKLAYPNGYTEENEARCNLYVLHVGESVRLIATLAGADDFITEAAGELNSQGFGDWRSDLGSKTAEVSPNGQSVAFSSTLPLTGYDNVAPSDPEHRAIHELFVYDWVGGGRLYCASCDPTGMPPTGPAFGASGPPSIWGTYLQRWLSEDGGRVFFDTALPLAQQDTNGWTDVYEWERGGEGSCGQQSGCVYLLSGGSSTGESIFLDASASGDDVFFMTRAQLVPEDHEESFHVFDARTPHVPGEMVGVASVAGAICAGAGCQASSPAVPEFAVPASAAFAGAGNLATPAPLPVVKPKPKKRGAVCRRGYARRRGRCLRVKTKPAAGHTTKAKGRR